MRRRLAAQPGAGRGDIAKGRSGAYTAELTRTPARGCRLGAHGSGTSGQPMSIEPTADDAELRQLDPASEELRARVAWLYYMEGMNQAEVAGELGLNRVRVNRILAQCRRDGMVQIRINSRYATSIDLERRLCAAYGLTRALVIPAPLNAEDLVLFLGNATGQFISELIEPKLSIGVAWGRTLRQSVRAVTPRLVPDLSVVALMGGLTRGSQINPHETAAQLASLFNAACFYVAAPAYMDTPEARDTLVSQAVLRAGLDRAGDVDVAVISVGEMAPTATTWSLGLLSEDDRRSLIAAGAVGDVLGHYINARGEVIDHPVNARVVAMAPERLRQVGRAILVAGGANKRAVIRGALAGGYFNTFITDEATATDLVTDVEPLIHDRAAPIPLLPL